MSEEYEPHMLVDVSNCDVEKLNDPSFIWKFLDELPGKIGMTKISPPYVLRFPALEQVGGVTGFVIIAESHISIHTYPEKNYFFLDVFSCKEFDVNKTKKYIFRKFKVKEADVQVIKRGKAFPK